MDLPMVQAADFKAKAVRTQIDGGKPGSVLHD